MFLIAGIGFRVAERLLLGASMVLWGEPLGEGAR